MKPIFTIFSFTLILFIFDIKFINSFTNNIYTNQYSSNFLVPLSMTNTDYSFNSNNLTTLPAITFPQLTTNNNNNNNNLSLKPNKNTLIEYSVDIPDGNKNIHVQDYKVISPNNSNKQKNFLESKKNLDDFLQDRSSQYLNIFNTGDKTNSNRNFPNLDNYNNKILNKIDQEPNLKLSNFNINNTNDNSLKESENFSSQQNTITPTNNIIPINTITPITPFNTLASLSTIAPITYPNYASTFDNSTFNENQFKNTLPNMNYEFNPATTLNISNKLNTFESSVFNSNPFNTIWNDKEQKNDFSFTSESLNNQNPSNMNFSFPLISKNTDDFKDSSSGNKLDGGNSSSLKNSEDREKDDPFQDSNKKDIDSNQKDIDANEKPKNIANPNQIIAKENVESSFEPNSVFDLIFFNPMITIKNIKKDEVDMRLIHSSFLEKNSQKDYRFVFKIKSFMKPQFVGILLDNYFIVKKSFFTDDLDDIRLLFDLAQLRQDDDLDFNFCKKHFLDNYSHYKQTNGVLRIGIKVDDLFFNNRPIDRMEQKKVLLKINNTIKHEELNGLSDVYSFKRSK